MSEKEIFSRHTFDPRKHSAVGISIAEKQALYSGSTQKGTELALKNYVVGPTVPPANLSLRRPYTAPATHKRYTDGTYDPQPKVLNDRGKWVQDQLPCLIAESQAQPLTATTTLTATLPGAHAAQQAVRPVTAVHTYNDVSPIVTADAAYDTDLQVTVVKESTISRPKSAVSSTMKATIARAAAPNVSTILSRTAKANGTAATEVAEPDARAQSIDAFVTRQAGSTFPLGTPDLDRTEELGKNVLPGSSNTRLIGSRWRYIQRPVQGDVVFTDYYGRYGGKMNDYYGRAYHVNTAHFNQNSLVGDLDYVKVQASMQGINTLRNRPGLAIQSTIVNGPSGRLHSLSAAEAHTVRGLHKLQEFTRVKPKDERDRRGTWMPEDTQVA